MNGQAGLLSARPRFYEGQYLSAEDLAAIVAYLSKSDARHALGAHTHGIVVGLYLTERTAPGGANRREVVLQPGFAWDGFGRPIVVTQPTRLPETLFASIPYAPLLDEANGASPAVGRLVKVWLSYAETSTRAPAPGFESCASADQNSRVLEGVEFVIGEAPGPAQRDEVMIGTESLPAEEQLRRFDPAAPLIRDGSVPHQSFPDNPRRRWLVPIGYVRWLARPAEPGYFLQRDLVAADQVDDRIRALRRYAGAVTEYIEAADGNIVLHRRDEDPLAPNKFAHLLAGGQDLAEHRGNLVWVEGNLRVGGDTKIAGGRLHLRDAAGLTQNTSLYLERSGDGSGAPGLRDLRAVIGPTSQTDNRFIVGPHDNASPPGVTAQLAVVSSGRVGVNTATPVATFDVRGNWDGTENGAVRIAGSLPTMRFGEIAGHDGAQWILQAETAGTFKFAHRIAPAQWKPALFLAPGLDNTGGGNEPGVGVRSDKPRNPLAVRAFGAWEELVSFEDPAGSTRWHLNQKVNGNTPGLNFAETGVADGRLFIKSGGDIGLGTLAPTNRLHVEGNTGIRQNRLYLSGGVGWSSLTYNAHHNDSNTGWLFPDPSRKSVTLEMDDSNGASRFEVYSRGTGASAGWTSHFKITGDNGNVAMAHFGGNVGIGTLTPVQKLHVAGSFLLVDGAGNEQCYLGGDAVAGDVQLGSMRAGVSQVALWNTADARRMDLFCRNITGTVTGPSDANLKERVTDIDAPLELLKKIRGVSFEWKDPERKGQADFGVIAQELRRVLPQLVTPREPFGVHYLSLIPILIEAVKELSAEVDGLRADVVRLAKKGEKKKKEKPAKGGD